MKKIFITDYIKIPDLEKKIFRNEAEIICLNQKDENKLPDEISEADGLLVWHADISDITCKKFKKNVAIIRYGVGYENINLKSIKKYNIIFANTPDYGVDEVADTSCALILNFVRKINLYNNHTKINLNKWQSEVININKSFPIKRTSDHNLGIIGLGRIGSSLAIKMKHFNMKVGFYDPYVTDGYEKVLGIKRFNTLDELKSNSSIISINASLNLKTKNMVDEKFINSLNDNTILINTARGQIIQNLNIILEGLKKNKLAGVGLDVLPEEPPKDTDNFIKKWKDTNNNLSDRIIINPHAGYYSTTSIKEMRIKASENMLNFLRGNKVRNIIDN